MKKRNIRIFGIESERDCVYKLPSKLNSFGSETILDPITNKDCSVLNNNPTQETQSFKSLKKKAKKDLDISTFELLLGKEQGRILQNDNIVDFTKLENQEIQTEEFEQFFSSISNFLQNNQTNNSEEKSEKSEKSERSERSEKSEKTEKSEKSEKRKERKAKKERKEKRQVREEGEGEKKKEENLFNEILDKKIQDLQKKEIVSEIKRDADMYVAERSFLNKFQREITKDDINFLQLTPPRVYSSLPVTSVKPAATTSLKELFHMKGPDEQESEVSFLDFGCGRTVSTYPHLKGFSKREGDPICDSFECKFYNKRSILVVADGCNWGFRPKLASLSASSMFVKYMEEHQSEIHTIREAGYYLLRAVAHAHHYISVTAEELEIESGSTTLLGGIVMELADDDNDALDDANRWVFVCVNIGDCKAFCVRPSEQKITELTMGNRADSTNASDPGGRIGPYRSDGSPDLRNLQLLAYPCRKDDIIIICSDGVFDNLDPKPQGVMPQDLGFDVESWDDENFSGDVIEEIFCEFRLQFLDLLLFDENHSAAQITPQEIVRKLIHHSHSITRSSRMWMRANPGKRLPSDFQRFPGKMDHATCVAVTIGPFEQQMEPTNEFHAKNQLLTCQKQWHKEPTLPSHQNSFKIFNENDQLPVVLNIPLSIALSEKEKEIIVYCQTIPRARLSLTADEKNVFLRAFPFEPLNYRKMFGKHFLFGLNELDQPVERVIELPVPIIPTSKRTEYDPSNGLVTIFLTKKPVETRRYDSITIY